MASGTGVKALIFDNDNTISKIYPDPKNFWLDVFIKSIKKCGGQLPPGSEHELMIAYYRNDDFTGKMKELGAEINIADFNRIKGEIDEDERLLTIKRGDAHLFPDAVETFAWARQRGIRIMVATFTTCKVVEAYFDKAGVDRPDAIFDWNESIRLGWAKPNRKIITHLLEPRGIDPSRAAMLGDRLTDVETGRNAGCKTFLVVRREEDGEYVDIMMEELEKARADPENRKVPHHMITKLTEAIPHLGVER